MGKEVFTNDKDINDLFLKVVNLVTQARERVATAVNIAEVYTKFHIGHYTQLPEGWAICKMKQITSITNGKSQKMLKHLTVYIQFMVVAVL